MYDDTVAKNQEQNISHQNVKVPPKEGLCWIEKKKTEESKQI
jgi:hypothetical protein